MPCGDCSGIKTELAINADKSYSLSSQYLGREAKPHAYKGTFYHDEVTGIITLDAEGDHLKFKLQDGSLKKLDKFGDDEQGAPAEQYILKKVD
ncbi:copper resistance protein NlpE [Flavobacterium zepuense]|uniref:Copper resistance protein NlpE n=1 Tax=Flavobacterium zepuense TaxID=2593302 RepID=A0A552UXD7_9FLAO|nr:copper resistance protein NlpE [Flavobacterium zepuense]